MAFQCERCSKKYKIVWRRVKLRGKYNPTTKEDKNQTFNGLRFLLEREFLFARSVEKS